MGGAVGTLQNDSNISKDIIDKVIINRDVKRQIAQKDGRLLKKYLSEPWKPHKDIIKLLTERTKHQLELITYIFSRANRIGGYQTDIADELMKLGGGYGDFLRLLVTRDFIIDTELIDTSLSSIGCDEEIVADILCASSDKEVKAMLSYYSKWKGETLLSKITSKTVSNSPFQKFILQIFQHPNRQSIPYLSNDAIKQFTHDLIQNGFNSSTNSGSSNRNDDIIFPILCQIPREQMNELSEQLESNCGLSLIDIIVKKYKGSIAYGLLLWTESSLTSAQSRRLHHILSQQPLNKQSINSYLSKYDRNTLIDILNKCDEMYPNVNLENKLYSLVTGHHREAIEGWINNHTCDGDHENAIKEKLLEYELNPNLIFDEKWKTDLINHLDGENAVLAKYISVHKVDLPRSLSVEARLKPLPPGSKRAEFLKNQQHQHQLHQQEQQEQYQTDNNSNNHNHDWNNDSNGSQINYQHHSPYSKNNNNNNQHNNQLSDEEIEWNRKCKLILELLTERFALEDIDNSGTLDSQEFWNILTSLSVGYSEQEIKDLQDWIDTDKDNLITYDEVVGELAESIVSTIEERSGISFDEKLQEIRDNCRKLDELRSAAFAASRGGTESNGTSTEKNFAPNIITYLKDTFDTVDVDKNGTLDSTEFWNILVSVLQLTEGDKQILSMEWDDNNDGKISWIEALDEFSKIFRGIVKDNRDHWIGLVDKTTQKYFWYNLKNDTSYWMTDEDENYFKSLISQGTSREEEIKPLSVPQNSINRIKQE